MKFFLLILFLICFPFFVSAASFDLTSINSDSIIDYSIKPLEPGQKDNIVEFYYKIPLKIGANQMDHQGELLTESYSERTQESETYYTESGKKLLKLYSRPKYYYQNDSWYLLRPATTTLSEIQEKVLSEPAAFHLINSAQAADSYFSNCDGAIAHLDAVGTNWNDIRNGNGTNAWSADEETRGPFITKTGGNYEFLGRGVMIFPTTEAAGNTIDSASLFLVGDSASTNSWTDSNGDIVITGSTITACPLLDSSYHNFDFENYSQKAYGDITKNNADYTEFVLNAAGISHITTAAATGFGLIYAADLSNSDPSAPGDSNFYWWAMDYTGTTRDPYLLLELSSTTAPVALSIGYTLNFMEFALILIIFAGFFLLIGLAGRNITNWLENLFYGKY